MADLYGVLEPEAVDGEGTVLNVGDRIFIDGEPRIYGEIMVLEWDIYDEDSPQGARLTIFMGVRFDNGDLETVKGNPMLHGITKVIEFSDYTKVVAQ